MKTFILQDGGRAEVSGILYTAGEAVNSNKPLDTMFPTRFKPAPAGIEGVRWPKDVNDLIGEEDFAVCPNIDKITFRIVDRKGKTVVGGASLSFAAALEKYREVSGKEIQRKIPVFSEENEEDASEVSTDDDAGSDSDEDSNDSDSDEDSDKESDDDERPAKRKNKQKLKKEDKVRKTRR